MLSLGALGLRSKPTSSLTRFCALFSKWAQWRLAWEVTTLLDQDFRCQIIKFFLYIFLQNFQNASKFPFWEKSGQWCMWKPLDLKKKENKSAACFVFATTTWSWSRASSVPSQSIVVHVNGLKSFKSKSKIKKTWMKKVSCECSGSILKNTKKLLLRQKTVYSTQSDSESLRSFNEKKNKTTSDSRAAISSSAPPKWRKTTKKNRNRKRFSCFFNNTTKGRTFQFLMTISNARSPTLPPS